MVRRSVVAGVLATTTLIATACPPQGGGTTPPTSTLNLRRVLVGTNLVPVDPSGGAQRSMSSDFSRAAVLLFQNGSHIKNIGVWNRGTGVTTQLTNLDAATFALDQPSISADGSSIFFRHMYSQIHPEDWDDKEVGVIKVDAETGAMEPISFGDAPGIWDWSVSGDGGRVLAKVGWNVMVSDGGAPTTLLTGTVTGAQYDVNRSSLSPNGRFAAIPTAAPVGGDQTTEQGSLQVLDLQLGTVLATWTGPTLSKVENTIASPYRININIASVADDGSVYFTQGVDGPLRHLDGTTGITTSTAVSDAFVRGGSSNGEHVLFVTHVPGGYRYETYATGTGNVDDAHAESAGGDWSSIGVSDDGNEILIYGSDPAYPTGFYIWDRTS
jgi:hypothetical protein